MTIRLTAPTREDVELVRQWRNQSIDTLRTPFLLTQEMQKDFYDTVVCNRQANSRFWTVQREWDEKHLAGKPDAEKFQTIGLVGLVGIEWENRLAEISLLLDPERRGRGYGTEALSLLLKKGFRELNLENIYGECYTCNPAICFWKKMIARHQATTAVLPYRKFWDGRYWDSLYFNFERGKANV